MILQSKAVYERKQWIKCQHCDYEWLSETKVTPDMKKKRVCCSKCRSSITVIFSDNENENTAKPKPKLVKSVQELEQVQDPQSALLWQKFEEAKTKNEMAMNKAVQNLLDRFPASSPETYDLVTAEARDEKAVWNQKMQRMSHAQKYAFMISEMSRIYDTFKDELSEEERRHFEARHKVEKKFADRIAEIESDEQREAQDDDMKYSKNPKQSNSSQNNKSPRRNKIKKRKVEEVMNH